MCVCVCVYSVRKRLNVLEWAPRFLVLDELKKTMTNTMPAESGAYEPGAYEPEAHEPNKVFSS